MTHPGQRRSNYFSACHFGLALAATIGMAGSALPARASARGAPVQPGAWPPLLADDEPVIVSEHRVETSRGPLVYEARVGRIPIRNADTGDLRGRIFYVAYVVKTKGKPRPITFAWGGGPLVASSIVHLEGIGPRRRSRSGKVDNAETLLTDTDLVFMDAVETGCSRPAKPEYAPEFMNMQGDIRATVEFIRAYRRRFLADDQPLFILGGSYGAFRTAAVADALTTSHQALAGAILISGDIPNIPQPTAFYDAMHVPARTATAFYYRRLDADLMRDRTATMRAAADWAHDVYMPALEHLDQLSPDQREIVARDLARYTGLRPDQIDRTTLVMHVDEYLTHFIDPSGAKAMTEEDTRRLVGDPNDEDIGAAESVNQYIRGELGYATDLLYAGLEDGYAPFPGPKPSSIRDQWVYNQPGVTPAVIAEFRRTGEVTPIAQANPPWIVNALKQDAALRVYVAPARYDPLNMCEGDVLAAAQLTTELRARMAVKCYESGHIIYREPVARILLLNDLSAFIRQTIAARDR